MDSTTPLAFDHLVVMVRDELEQRAPAFERSGYRLSELSVHNLGSINRLIVLDSTYLELLGWPAGEPPRRKEIAEQPLGLDALVWRSEDAAADHDRLKAAGFDVQPVGRLERPLEFHGEQCLARFNTVRFNTQPVDGLRMYVCQHLTPEYVWDAPLMRHSNGATRLESIEIATPDTAETASILSVITGASACADNDTMRITLPNLELKLRQDSQLRRACIAGAWIRHADDTVRQFQMVI